MAEITLTQAPAHLRMGSSIGQPLTRREGVLKTTGAARFAADNHPAGMVYAAIATSSIARGRVTNLDVAAARAHPGVIEVMTPANAPKLAMDPDAKLHPFKFKMEVLQTDAVRYANQAIAVVIAETLEAATEGAALLAPQYDAEAVHIGLDTAGSFAPPIVGAGSPAAESTGDFDAGLAAASVRMEPPPTTHRRSITTRWSRMRLWPYGTVTPSRSIRPARAWPWHNSASAACSASRRRMSPSAARISAAASAPRGWCPARRSWASWPPAWSAAR